MRKFKVCLLTLVTILSMVMGCSSKENGTRIVDLTTNNKINPIGIEENIYFGWKMSSVKEGQRQIAYQIMVSDTAEQLSKNEYVWDSGKIVSDCSVAIPYEGDSLEMENDYFWQVKVWDMDEEEILSEVAFFELGKSDGSWENTNWITCPQIEVDKKYTNLTEEMEVSEISYEFKMEDTETGFVWGGKKGQYGEYYLWSFKTLDNNIEMKISHKNTKGVLEIKEKVVIDSEYNDFLTKNHNVRIEIKDGKATTYLDSMLASADIELEGSEVGGIGFWVTRGAFL